MIIVFDCNYEIHAIKAELGWLDEDVSPEQPELAMGPL